jgi:DNA recombination protein RmuC
MNDFINSLASQPIIILSIILAVISIILVYISITKNSQLSETKIRLEQLNSDYGNQIIKTNALTKDLLNSNQIIKEQISAISKLQTASDLYKATLEEQQSENKNQRSENISLLQEISNLKIELSKNSLHLDEARNYADSLEKNLSEAMQNFKNEISIISKNIVNEGTRNLNEQNKHSFNELLAPLNSKFGEFKDEIQKTREASIKNQSLLSSQIINLHEAQIRLSNEANNLSKALHDQKKTQGMWGELILEKVLESAGLRKGIEYKREVCFKNEDQKNQRPDAIVYLPNNRELIIDAKCSLNDFINYTNTENSIEKESYLKAHTNAIRRHIITLSERYYSKLASLNSPNLVFMFMPAEGPLEAAIYADPTLINFALKQHIAITTPNTLLSSLAIAKELWELENRNKTTDNLIKNIQGVYDKLRCFLENFVKIGNSIATAQNIYDEAQKQLCIGKGNLVVRGKEIAKMLNSDKTIPQELLNIMEYSNNNINFEYSNETTSDSDEMANNTIPIENN